MRKPPPEDAAESEPTLTIPLERVCWIITKAREFDVKDGPGDGATGSNASDDNMIGVLEDRPDDPVREELVGVIEGLTQDEQIELVALTWLGRDGGTLEDWPSLCAEAARSRANNPRRTSRYLLGDPLVSDFLAEGLATFGLSCAGID